MSNLNPITEQASSKAINASINMVRKHFAKGNELIHTTACMVIEHASKFGDVTGAARLVNALPKSSVRRGIVAKWFSLHSPIIVEIKGGEYKAHKAGEKNTKVCQTWEVERARANPFWDMPEAQKEETFLTSEDFNESLARLISRYSNAIKENKIAANDVEKVKASLARLASFERDVTLDTQHLGTWEPAPVVNTEGLKKAA